MSLTSGRGPLSTDPAGRFSPPVPDGLAYIEPFCRRVRAERGGALVIDSEQVLLVHRRGNPPAYVFPAGDVDGSLAAATEPEALAPGHVRVRWDAVDAWYEEREQVFLHPRNPYHRVDLVPTDRRLRVEVAGVVLVDTTDTMGVYETSLPALLYVAKAHVAPEVLVTSTTTTYCPYKGTASYWSVVAGGVEVADAAWSYEDPLPACEAIAGMVCFDGARVSVSAALPAPAPLGPTGG